MEFEISLNAVRFHAFHGVFPQERSVGNEFVVDVAVRIPYKEEISDDDLSATISYSDLYDLVKEEMDKPHKLLETVAANICKRLRAHFPEIISGSISICKTAPPIPNICGSAGVKLIF